MKYQYKIAFTLLASIASTCNTSAYSIIIRNGVQSSVSSTTSTLDLKPRDRATMLRVATRYAMPKIDGCPPNYLPWGEYCMAKDNASYAISKTDGCPPNYLPWGKYCMAKRGAKYMVPKIDGCPPGYLPWGSDCIAK